MRRTFAILLLGVCLAGCGDTGATLELVRVARIGLAEANANEQAVHERTRRLLEADLDALGAAFDADVAAAFAGRIAGPDGAPLEPDAQWVRQARQGYTAGVRLTYENLRAAEADHAARVDNLAASDEALHLAEQLLERRLDVETTIERRLVDMQRRHIHD